MRQETRKDKKSTALVTGASRGIGRAIAVKLAKDGFHVLALARNQDNLDAVVAEIQESGGSASSHPCDLSDSPRLQAVIQEIAQSQGAIDVLVNNAGMTRDGLIMRMKDGDWDAVLNVNLKAVFIACREVTRGMVRARRGRIINVSSLVGLTGNAGQVNYSSSKAGLIGLTKSLAKELGSRGITVNAVAPGYIETDMTANFKADRKAELLKRVPLGRFGAGEEIACVVSFLASEAAAYITGEVIRVDGGLAM